ncbi:uncharacterized protein LOC135200702 [Macrobrachium nipponense]|uniref:uncharacterized protein LOC135200702 n=1 Tax=Macrobrachium nipponense TaxID=159736 RepID=UPI0030C7C87B
MKQAKNIRSTVYSKDQKHHIYYNYPDQIRISQCSCFHFGGSRRQNTSNENNQNTTTAKSALLSSKKCCGFFYCDEDRRVNSIRMNWEEELTGSVHHYLPGLCEEKVQQVVTHLIEVTGVESMGDTSLVTEADLIEVLKPLQSRKLIAGWNPKGSEGVSTSLLPQPPQRVPMLVLDDIPGPLNSEWVHEFTIPWENTHQNCADP